MDKSYHARLEDQQKRPSAADKAAAGLELEKAREQTLREGRDFNPRPSYYLDDIDLDRWNERI